MYSSKNNTGAAALIFSKDSSESFTMLVSSPPPIWLSEKNLTEICVNESGMYCLCFLFFSEEGVSAHLTVNGRKIPGSETNAENGIICNSAVCSIRDAALPCCLSVTTDKICEIGVFLVIQCRI